MAEKRKLAEDRGIVGDELKEFLNRTAVEKKFEVVLRSAGFDIDPAKNQKINKGDFYPVKKIWTIRPKSKGNQVFLLDISDSPGHRFELFSPMHAVDTEYEELVKLDSDNGMVVINVSVTGLWGLSSRAASLVMGFFSLIGFIIMVPATYELFRWFKGKRLQSTLRS